METASGPFVDEPKHSSLNLGKDPPKTSGVATFEPYLPDTAVFDATTVAKRKLDANYLNNAKFSRKSCNAEQFMIMPGVVVPNSYDKYLTLDLEYPPDSIFDIHRDIVKCCGRKPKISTQTNGHLLVEVNSPEESNKLKTVSSLGGILVRCSPHYNLNSSKGLIYAPQLMTFSEETLQKEFENQGVVRVQRMKKKIDGAITPQPGLILTFNSIRLPASIEAAWYTYKVKQFIPRPRRCFYCQQFGHTVMSCRLKTQGRPAVCVICSDEEHGSCDKDPKCYHCGGNHASSSIDCDVYLFEKEVQATRVKERVSFTEARQKVKSRFIRPGLSFAKVMTESVAYKKNRNKKVDRHNVELLTKHLERKPAKRALSRESSEDSIQIAPSSQISVVSPLMKRKGPNNSSPASQEAPLCISTVDVEVHAPMEAESPDAGDSATMKDAPVLGASASLEATVAVLDAATPVVDIPKDEMESGNPKSVGVACIQSTCEEADKQASGQVTPAVSKTPSSSRVVIPKTLRRSKKDLPMTNKPQKLINASETSSEGSHRRIGNKAKIKLQKSSLK